MTASAATGYEGPSGVGAEISSESSPNMVPSRAAAPAHRATLTPFFWWDSWTRSTG
jgi:hypothetical protein